MIRFFRTKTWRRFRVALSLLVWLGILGAVLAQL